MLIPQKKILNYHVKEYKKNGNNVNYQKKNHNVLLNEHKDIVLNKGFRYVNGTMKSYEQVKKGLSYAYHKIIVQEDVITTKALNI